MNHPQRSGQSFRITFNRPCLSGQELPYFTKAIEASQAAGDGAYAFKCHKLLEEGWNVA